MKVRYTLFGSKAKGGYFRIFEAVDYPGIVGSVDAETRKSKPVIKYVLGETEYTSEAAAIEAWRKENADVQDQAPETPE